MDALTLLMEDHAKVMGMFKTLEETEEPDKRKQGLAELLKELKVHERIEEEIFYPAVDARAKKKALKELVIESYVEHAFVDKISADLVRTEPDAEAWPAKLKVIKENVEHHAKEEEEGKLFPKVRELFSADELAELGAEMTDLKEETIEEMEEAVR